MSRLRVEWIQGDRMKSVERGEGGQDGRGFMQQQGGGVRRWTVLQDGVTLFHTPPGLPRKIFRIGEATRNAVRISGRLLEIGDIWGPSQISRI